MEYEILDSDLLGRVGKLEYKDYKIVTPNLLPVIHPFDNIIEPSKIKDIGFNCIFTNAYIIYQNIGKRQEILNNGLKNYLNFDGLIATDSGAFQQYMYHKEDIKISAQEIENFQEEIGSDFPVILDVPVQPDDEYIQAKEKIEKSLIRAQSNIKNRRREKCWIGPIHGAKYSDLLRKSTKKMSELDFGIYAIGGLVKFFLDYRFKQILNILLTVKKNIIQDKPLHMFGLGLPQFFSLAVACGCDLMDSAAYILYAKENRYFTLTTGTKRLDELKEFPCNCPICSRYKPIELKKLNQNKKIRLLALHNLYISQQELKTIRQAIYEGNLWELIEERVRAHPNLSDCLNIIRKNASFFEEFEKIYKDHGRLFSSFESIYRPILIRYKQRLRNRYRVPEGVKYLIILPELDIKGKNSPSINTWLNEINTNKIISRDLIHVAFYSEFFGLIPLELIQTFPMGQHESINLNTFNLQEISKEIANIILDFIRSYGIYEKIGFLNPDFFINQYQEEKNFTDNQYERVINTLQTERKIKVNQFKKINNIIEFFNQ